MEFKEKYISTTAKLEDKENKNIVLSDDAYAIGEMIGNLIKELERAKLR